MSTAIAVIGNTHGRTAIHHSAAPVSRSEPSQSQVLQQVEIRFCGP